MSKLLRVGVIGDPVEHSISPAMQQPALDAMGIDATYERWLTPAAELGARIASLRGADVLGANVTVPHKQAVMSFLDGSSALARRAGAVNTIIPRRGALLGDNTDVHGFATALLEVCPNPRERSVLLLGAGGAARGVVLALESLGVARIAISNRSQERADRLAADLAPTPIRIVHEEPSALQDELEGCTLLINTTSIGWHRGEMPMANGLLARLPDQALVVDLTYRDTDFLEAARARGLATLDGLPMLVHQGARALELWTGRQAPIELMRSAAIRARAARA